MWYDDLRDNFFNAVISFALKHCHLYAPNIYAMFEKVPKNELMCMYKSYEEYMKAKNRLTA